MPTYKRGLRLDDAWLGVPLFAMVVGSMIAMPAAGAVLTRRGSRGVSLLSAVLFCLSPPVLAATAGTSLAALTIAAAAFGAIKGGLDVAANAQAVAAERHAGRHLMSFFHGCWSMGMLGGSLIAAGALDAGFGPIAITLAASALLFVVVGSTCRGLPDDEPDAGSTSSGFVLPRGRLGTLAALAFLGLFCEGAMGDWAAVYLVDVVGATPASAAFGLSAYATVMMIGRFTGDRLVSRLGATPLLVLSGLTIAAGLGTALTLKTYAAALVGFAMTGFGTSNMVPILFRSAGRSPNSAASIASVATVGYLGFLAGPPLISALSRGVGLAQALALVAAFGLAVACGAPLVDERREPDAAILEQGSLS